MPNFHRPSHICVDNCMSVAATAAAAAAAEEGAIKTLTGLHNPIKIISSLVDACGIVHVVVAFTFNQCGSKQ